MAHSDDSDSYYTTDSSDCEVVSSQPAMPPPRLEQSKGRKEPQSKDGDASKRAREVRESVTKGAPRAPAISPPRAENKKKADASKRDRDVRESDTKGGPRLGGTRNDVKTKKAYFEPDIILPSKYVMHSGSPRHVDLTRDPPWRTSRATADARERSKRSIHDEQPQRSKTLDQQCSAKGSSGKKGAARHDISRDAEEMAKQKKPKLDHQSSGIGSGHKKESSKKGNDAEEVYHGIDNISSLVKYFAAGWLPSSDYEMLCRAADGLVVSGTKETVQLVESFTRAFLYKNGDQHSEVNTGLKQLLARLAELRDTYASPFGNLTDKDTSACIQKFSYQHLLTPTEQALKLRSQRSYVNRALKRELGSQQRLRSVVQVALPVFSRIRDRRDLLEAFIKYIADVEEHAASRHQELLAREEESQFAALRSWGEHQKSYSKRTAWRGESRSVWHHETRKTWRRHETGEARWPRQTKDVKESTWRRDPNEERWHSDPKEQNANRWHNGWDNNRWNKDAWQGRKSAWGTKPWSYGKTMVHDGIQEGRECSVTPSCIAALTEEEHTVAQQSIL